MPRISLRQMFLLVAVVALAIASLIYASPTWQSMIGLVVVLTVMVAIIVSLIDRGPRRAFAIGFAVASLGYLVVVANAQYFGGSLGSGDSTVELDVYQGRLPTSILLKHLYTAIGRTTYYDFQTGEQIPESQSANLYVVAEWPGFGGGGGFGGGAPINVPAGQRAATVLRRPPSKELMVQGHLWWALLFGYVGGHFGRFVDARRTRESQSKPLKE